MSMHDKTLFFFDKTALAATAATSITSKVIDFRYNGGLDDCLYINAILMASATDGAVTLKIQTSATGADESWSDVVTKTNVGEILYKGRLPSGLKRFVRCTVTVGNSNLTAATSVFAEITDTIDEDLDQSKVQKWNGIPEGGTVPEGMEDLASSGDSVVNPEG